MSSPLANRFITDAKKLKLRFPIAEISKATGYSKSNVSEYYNGVKDPSSRFLAKFYSFYYPELGVAADMVVSEPDGSETYVEQRRKQKLEPSIFMVPVVPVKAQAGYVKSYSDTDYINNLKEHPIVPGIEPRGSTWRYFEVEGDSMRDTLAPRDYVLCNFVPDFDWMETKDNYVHVIITKDRVLIKRLKKATTEYFLAKSDNPEYKNKTERIMVKDILELWRARRKIGADLGPTRITKHYELD